MKIVYISLYSFKTFPVRIFHALSHKEGVDSYTIFFKNSHANSHPPVTDKEVKIFLNLIKKINPDFIAFSILAPYVVVAKQLIQEIRKIFKVPIIVGGKYPTVFPEQALVFADFVCRGEGELVLMEIFERFSKGLDFKDIQGLCYKDENGRIINKGQRMLIQDIDQIPFPSVGDPQMYFIENDCLIENDPELSYPLIWMMSGMGCAFQCSYCVNSLLVPMNKGNGRFLRQRTPDNVIEEIELRLKKNKYAEKIWFIDELFGTSLKWTMEFCEKYKKKVGLPFSCELNPVFIKEENIEILSNAGLFELNFGIQSGSDYIRNEIFNRPGTNREILKKANILRKYNVTPRYDLILNNPFDTVKVLEDTIDLLCALPKPVYFNTYKMQFFPEYPFTLRALKEGFIKERDISDEKLAQSVFKNWAFIPKVFSFNRKDYLESCIYLLAWNFMFGKIISVYLLKKENHFLGLIANILARINYYSIFVNWPSRLLLGIKLLFRGNLILYFLINRRLKLSFKR